MAGVPRLRAHRAREALRSPGLARPDPVDVKLTCATEGGRRKAANGDSSLLKRLVDLLERECITGHIFLCETTLLEKERESITTGHGYFSLSR